MLENTTLSNKVTDSLYVKYEAAMEADRLAFAKVTAPLLAERDPQTVMFFWLTFSSNGVHMTEPVENWIRRAGNKCKILGYQELGEKLCKHAVHEADHQLMMIEDTKNLVNKWNEKYSSKLNADVLLSQKPSDIVIQYQKLHEDYIESESPYCQIAIEYEIESLSAHYLAEILNHAFAVLGETEIKHCLSFLDDHVKIDVAHTKYNRAAISQFLEAHPKALNNLIEAGKKALRIYGGFLSYCHREAKNFQGI